MPRPLTATVRHLPGLALAVGLLAASGCGAASPAPAGRSGGTQTAASAPVTTTATLPGQGRPTVTVGDKNYTEQFVLGELYYQALAAQGFSVLLDRNIGPTQVTLQALRSGQLGLYPEYLNTWDSAVAGYHRVFGKRSAAYRAAQLYALNHGMELLNPTPFSDTDAIGVTVSFAQQHHLRSIADLRRVASSITLGVPPQFEQSPEGLPALEQSYGFTPAIVKALEIGPDEYQALDQDTVQAADVNTTDAELTTGDYTLLGDPKGVLGVGNVVPVVSAKVLDSEGPAFAATINRVTALLTLPAMRALNASVDLAGEDPAAVAKRFLVDHGVMPATPS